MSAEKTENWPTEIRLNKEKDKLIVTFQSNDTFELRAEYLRVYSPSAEVKGHGAEPRKIVLGKQNVRIVNIEMIGHYAVKLIFDDRHDTGIYTWDYLHELGKDYDLLWADYLEALEDNDLARRD